jgi:transposase
VKEFLRISRAWERRGNRFRNREESIVMRVRTPPKRRGGPRPKLDDAQLRQLKKLVLDGQYWTPKLLAERFGVHSKTIKRDLKKLGLTLKKPPRRPRRRS